MNLSPTDRALASIHAIEQRAKTIGYLSPTGIRQTSANEILMQCAELRALIAELADAAKEGV